jgi:hypothetical protein
MEDMYNHLSVRAQSRTIAKHVRTLLDCARSDRVCYFCQFECFFACLSQKNVSRMTRKNIHGTLLDTMHAKRQQASLEVTERLVILS